MLRKDSNRLKRGLRSFWCSCPNLNSTQKLKISNLENSAQSILKGGSRQPQFLSIPLKTSESWSCSCTHSLFFPPTIWSMGWKFGLCGQTRLLRKLPCMMCICQRSVGKHPARCCSSSWLGFAEICTSWHVEIPLLYPLVFWTTPDILLEHITLNCRGYFMVFRRFRETVREFLMIWWWCPTSGEFLQVDLRLIRINRKTGARLADAWRRIWNVDSVFFSLKAGYILASDWHNFRQCQDPDAQEERYKVDEIGRIAKLDKFKK